MLSLYKLEVFNAVIEAGSFSRAAERLYLTQSAVSQHIQDLEASLGARLFERRARGVELTSAGQVLQDYTRCILNLLAEAQNAVTNVEQLSSGQIRVGATPGAGGYLVPEWMQSFRERYPRLTIALTTDVTAEIVTRILSRALDIGFVEGEIDDQTGLETLELQAIPQYVVIGRTHPWYGRQAIAVRELDGQPLVIRPAHSQTRVWLDGLLTRWGVKPVMVAELDSLEAIKQALIAGMGFSILPEYVVRRECDLGVLAALPVHDALLDRTLRLIWDGRRPLNPVSRAFLRHLSSAFPQLLKLVARLGDVSEAVEPEVSSSALDACRTEFS